MIIVTDPGHGDQDHGGRSLGRPEKDTVLRAQSFLWKALAEMGHAVIPTRVKDVFLPLGERARFANVRGATCLVSLHCNASGNPEARGPWTLYAAPSTAGRALASAIQAPLAAAAGGNRNAVYPDASDWVGNRRLAVLRQTRMPAVIVELGFMTNPGEATRLESDDYLEMLAQAIATGIHGWRP